MKLAELHWPEVKKLDRENIVALVPVGSMEQHGPHLPFQVDVFIASRLAEDVENEFPRFCFCGRSGPAFLRTTWISPARSQSARGFSWICSMTFAPRFITTGV